MSRPRIWAFASGKGGVGRTVLATGLAQAMAQEDRSVLLVDADLGTANVDLQLGLRREHDLADVVAGRVSLRDAVQHDPRTGIDVIAGSSGTGHLSGLDLRSVDRLVQELGRLAEGYDVTIVDLGGDLEPAVRRFAAMAQRLFVVTSAEPAALADAYAFIKVTRELTCRRDIVVNMASDESEGAETYAVLRRVCAHFLKMEPKLLGIVHRDPRVGDALRAQVPLMVRHPGSRAAEDILRIARRLTGQMAEAPATAGLQPRSRSTTSGWVTT